jgi:hypothetical protein
VSGACPDETMCTEPVGTPALIGVGHMQCNQAKRP